MPDPMIVGYNVKNVTIFFKEAPVKYKKSSKCQYRT